MDEQNRNPILEVKHLNSWYTAGGPFSRKKRQAVLKDVTFTMYEGEILGLGGLSECGMHELGRILFGVDSADTGKVTVTATGEEIRSPRDAIRNSVGYMSKNRDTEALILNYSIEDNICLPSLNDLAQGPFIWKKKEDALADKWSGELAIKMPNGWATIRRSSLWTARPAALTSA